jgi:leucyl/phenylalanyl-tRNA--protein transferase
LPPAHRGNRAQRRSAKDRPNILPLPARRRCWLEWAGDGRAKEATIKAIGKTDRLTPELLLRAYALGIFPMARERLDPYVSWVSPRQRGILPLDRFHVPRRLRRTVRQGLFQVLCDTAFERVIRACAAPAPGRRDTWINTEILRGYVGLHRLGYAHSVETWRNGRLVGGLYGVALGAAFFGESMFSWETDASKVALVHLVARLRLGGYRLLDVQFVTDHLSQFGAVEVPAAEYLDYLDAALDGVAVFSRSPAPEAVEAALEALLTQSSTQIS